MWVCSRACAGKTKFGSSKFTLFPQVAKSFFLGPPQCKNLYFLKSVFFKTYTSNLLKLDNFHV